MVSSAASKEFYRGVLEAPQFQLVYVYWNRVEALDCIGNRVILQGATKDYLAGLESTGLWIRRR